METTRLLVALLKSANRIEHKLDLLLKDTKKEDTFVVLDEMKFNNVCPVCNQKVVYRQISPTNGKDLERSCGCVPKMF